MKILFWDVETSTIDLLIRQYDLKSYKGRHSPDTIQRDWHMLGAAWMYLEDETPKCISVSPKDPLNDYEVITALYDILNKADVLVGHNSDSFDLKKFNTRALKCGLPPLSPKQTIDTLKIARRYFAVTSNKLSYLADFLGVEAKGESPDWDKCLAGDADELRLMRDYNKQDVVVTRDVYLKLRPWMDNHPNHNAHHTIAQDGADIGLCPKCASPDLQKRGYNYSKTGKRQAYRCMSCGGYCSSSKSIKVTGIR